MISYEDFFAGIKGLADLTGLAIKKTQVDAFYEVLNGVDHRDFTRGVVSLAESGEKISLFSLRKYINIHQAERLEREAEERRVKENASIKEFWQAHFREGACVKHECGKCPKIFCMIVSNACIKGLKEVLSGVRTPDEVHIDLAKQFPGIGFESHTSMEPF